MIWAEPGYHTIESDVNTDQGNFILGFMDHGTWNSAKAPMAFAGQTLTGEVSFNITGWKYPAAPDWPETWYGVFKVTKDLSGVYNLVEIAASKTAISHLDGGLAEGAHYMVGISCLDSKYCNFGKASPTGLQSQTQEIDYYDFLDEAFL